MSSALLQNSGINKTREVGEYPRPRVAGRQQRLTARAPAREVRRSLPCARRRKYAVFFVGVEGLAWAKVEANFSMFAVKLTLLNKLTIGDFNRSAIRPVAGGEGKVIPQVFITVEIRIWLVKCLAGPARKRRSGYAPDGYRDAPTGWGAFALAHPRTAVARRHDATHAIAGHLRRCGMRRRRLYSLWPGRRTNSSPGVGVPDIHNGVSDRTPRYRTPDRAKAT